MPLKLCEIGPTYFIVGFLPVFKIRIIARLAHAPPTGGNAFMNVRLRSRSGNPTILRAKLSATMTASGVEWATHSCLLLITTTGQLVNVAAKHMATNRGTTLRLRTLA